MANVSVPKIVSLVVALLLMGILLPIGFNEILGFTSTDSTIQTLVATVLPVMSAVGLVLAIIPRTKGD